MYNKKVFERFTNPKFGGEMKTPDAIGEVGNMKCGDVMRIFIKVKDNKISDISFQTYGCVAAIAASDSLCELAKGKTLTQAMKISDKDIINNLGELPAIKFHCSVLGTNALKNAIENYKKSKSDKGLSSK